MPDTNSSTSLLAGADPAKIEAALKAEPKRPPSPPMRKLSAPPPQPTAKEIKDLESERDAWDFTEDDDDTTIDSKPSATAKTTPAKKPAAPKTYEHTPRLLGAARRFGISPQEAALMPPDELLREVNAASIEAREAEMDRQRQREQQKPADKPAEDEVDWGTIDTIDPETGNRVTRKAVEADFSPGLVKRHKEQHKEIQELKETTKQLARREQSREQARQYDLIEGGFEAIKDGYGKFLGDVAAADMTPGDATHAAYMKRRMAVLGISNIDFNKDSPKTVAKKIKAATEELYGPPEASEPDPEAVAAAAKKTKQQEREAEWAEAGTALPTQRKAPPQSGKKAAMEEIRNIRSKAKERDIEADSNIPDDLPD